jgi:hypothetical protein
MSTETRAQGLVVRFDGVFDMAAAENALKVLAQVPAGSEIYIDLTQVREFHDRGVALLAEGLANSSRRVAVRGLGTHQYRMLRYMGVNPSALDIAPLSRPYAPAADVS